MAAPLLPVFALAIRGLGHALSRWQGILAFAGLIAVTSFSFSSFFNQATESIRSLWPILSVAFAFLLLREIVRSYFKLKNKEIDSCREQKNGQ